jgi:hypothetical protein
MDSKGKSNNSSTAERCIAESFGLPEVNEEKTDLKNYCAESLVVYKIKE